MSCNAPSAPGDRVPASAPGTARSRWVVWTWALLIVLFYACYFGHQAAQRGLFEYVGIDFRIWWAVAEVAARDGLAAVYRMDSMESYQSALYATYAHAVPGNSIPYHVMPAVYPPVFLLPMRLLHGWAPLPAFALWLVVNLLAYLACVEIWRRRAAPGSAAWGTLLAWLSLPGFLNLLVGNVSNWLALALIAVFVALDRHRPLLAGACLALLTVKPQCALLVLPALLLARELRMAAGFCAGGALLAAVSLALVGLDGARDLLYTVGHLQRAYGDFPESMTNWRMVGVVLDHRLPVSVANAVSHVGTALTALAVLFACARCGRTASASVDQRERRLLVIASAMTGGLLTAWHAQAHMSLALVPVLLVLLDARLLAPRWALVWLAAPLLVFAAGYFGFSVGMAHRGAGAALFLAELLVLAALLRRMAQCCAGQRFNPSAPS